ncbi:MAG: hypothetical protein U1E46_18575 [Hyphomicrobiales bacterium]
MTKVRKSLKTSILAATAVVGLAMVGPQAHAATYNVTFNDFGSNVLGTGQFDAPSGGGSISNFVANIGAITYNIPLINGNFNGVDAISLQVSASLSPPAIIGLLATGHVWGSLATLTSQLVQKGTYSIAAVPIPAALPLFTAGLAGVGYVSRKKKKQVKEAA